jgi:2-polyprenyl-3-methyl-5-hydroxy-6-metoxy-1,4-benzoquinol methylase
MKRSRSNWIRTKAWDWEFKHGKWDYLKAHGYDQFYEMLVGRLKGGSLLDLGCGNGSVRVNLPAGAMRRYVGLDYSAEAIGQLEQRAAELPPLPDGQTLLVGDMTDCELLQRTGGNFDVVLLHECLNYVEVPRVPDYLRHLCGLMKPGGVVMIRIWERNRYADHVSAIRTALHIVEEVTSETQPSIFIVADGPLP